MAAAAAGGRLGERVDAVPAADLPSVEILGRLFDGHESIAAVDEWVRRSRFQRIRPSGGRGMPAGRVIFGSAIGCGYRGRLRR